MLTAKQAQLLAFIHGRQQEGVCPSFPEIMAAMGLRSKSSITRLLDCLQERGFIRRPFNRARAIEILRLPGNALYEAGYRDGYAAALKAMGQEARP